MDSCSSKASFGVKYVAKGAAGSPRLTASATKAHRTDFTGSGKMIYDAFRDGATLSIPAGATETIDMTGGRFSPLNESIAGALDFAVAFSLLVVHDAASIATNIRVFDASTGNSFQGPVNAGGKVTLAPKQGVAFITQADGTGWTVDATHRKIDILNLDGVNAATVRVFIQGTT